MKAFDVASKHSSKHSPVHTAHVWKLSCLTMCDITTMEVRIWEGMVMEMKDEWIV